MNVLLIMNYELGIRNSVCRLHLVFAVDEDHFAAIFAAFGQVLIVLDGSLHMILRHVRIQVANHIIFGFPTTS